MMDEQSKRKLIEKYLKAYNTFDIDGMLTTLHPDVEFRNISGGKINTSTSGIEEFHKLAEEAKKIFKSRNQSIISFMTAEDKTIIEIEYEGVLATDLPNGMKAGQVINLNGRSEFEFKNGKISSITDIS